MARFTRRTVLGMLPAGALAQPEGDLPDLTSVPPDLVVPEVTDAPPAPGRRVRQTLPEYRDTRVHHALYLPRDWKRGHRYPVIVEYAGNGNFRNSFGDVSNGEVEGSKLGYGISAGKGFIWISMPYVNARNGFNQTIWWGDVEATLRYCRDAVRMVCENYGGDPAAVILAGFSRGAIGCNYLGLHHDGIADLWLAFIPYSHYDGVRTTWPYPKADRESALERLGRLKGRAVFVAQERSIEATSAYIQSTGVRAPFTYQRIAFRNHNDAWTLRDIPERRAVRQWLSLVLRDRPGTHSISGQVVRTDRHGVAGARVQSGDTHWAVTDRGGHFTLPGLIDGEREVRASKTGLRFGAQRVTMPGRNIDGLILKAI